MKNILDVLQQKEAELGNLQREVEALRLAIHLVSEEGDPHWEPRPLAPTGTNMRDARVKGAIADISNSRSFP